MKFMQYLNNKYTGVVAAGTLLFQLASCGFGRIDPAGQPELMDSLMQDSNKYHISYSGEREKPGAVLFDPKSDNINLERGEKWASIEDKKQLESMIKSMVDEYNGTYPGNENGEKATLNAVKGNDGNVIGYLYSPVPDSKVRPAGDNYKVDSVSTIDAENRKEGGDSSSTSPGESHGPSSN